MKIYTYNDYRKLIRDRVKSPSHGLRSMTFARLADSVRIQRSYLSQVMSGKAHLNSDQLYSICKKLKFNESETNFILLLLELEKTTLAIRKDDLENKVKKIRSKNLSSQKYLKTQALRQTEALNMAQYYSEPLCSQVHMLLTIKKYCETPKLIAERLKIGEERLLQIFETLEECGVLRRSDKGLELLKKSLHLKKESYLTPVHSTLFRLKAIEAQQMRDLDEDYFFTATFSSNEHTRKVIQQNFLEFLEKTSKLIATDADEDIFHINFDLFRL